MRKLFFVFIFVLSWLGASQTNAAGLIDTIPLGNSAKPVAIAVNEVTHKIYVADAANNEIAVINGITNQILSRIPINGTPLAVAVNSAANKVYVLSNGHDQYGYYFLRTLINGNTNAVLSNFIGPFPRPRQSKPFKSADMSISNDSNLIFLITKHFNDDNQKWYYVDTCYRLDFEILGNCGVSSSETTEGSMSPVIENLDLSINENIVISVGNGETSWRLIKPGLTPFLSPIYPANCPSVSFPKTISTTANKKTKNFLILNENRKIVSYSLFDYYFVSGYGWRVEVDCKNVAQLSTQSSLSNLTLNEIINIIYLVKENDTIIAVDSASGEIIGTVSVGLDPAATTVNSATNRIYTANSGDGTISVVEGFLPPPTILLPGILGSWTGNFFEPFINPNPIEQNKLSLTEESQSWIWKQLDALGYLPHTWQLLKTFLPATGHPSYKCPYDWRNNNQYNAEHYLIPCIDKAKAETGASKVNIIAHSMGGLVARSYIQNDTLYRNDVARLAFVGTPNHGSPEAYYFWEGADLTHGWFGILGTVMEKVAGGRLFQMGVHYARMGTVAYAHGFFPSVQELLPTFDYLKDQLGNTRDIVSMLWQNTLLKDINARPNITKLTNPVLSKVFAGEGHSTLETIRVLYPNPDNLSGNPLKPYPDGQPIPLFEENNLSGDVTVLSQKSAKITEANIPFEVKTKTTRGAENFLEHTNLPNSFFNEILTFLGGAATTTPAYTPRFPNAMLAVSLASPADLLVIGPDGKKLGFDTPSQTEAYEITKGIYSGRNDLELAAIIDPQPGKYTVLITGNGTGEFNSGISYAKEGCVGAVNQDNFGQIATGTVTLFTLNLQGGCGEKAATYTLDASVNIDPNTLNLSSKGNYVTAYIELPPLYKVNDIDVSTVKMNEQIPALSTPIAIGDYNKNGVADLMVKFGRDEVQKIVTIGKNELIVSGNLSDGTMFAGKSVLNVISNPPPQKFLSFFDFLFVLLGKFGLVNIFSSFK